MDTGSRSFLRGYVPEILLGFGTLITIALLGVTVSYNGLPPRSGRTWYVVMDIIITGPFVGALLFGGYWLRRSDVPTDRYPRIAAWFGAGSFGFLLLNVFIMAVGPPLSTYDYVKWGLFVTSVGAIGGLGVGLFEARAIDRAVTAERHRVKRREVERQNERLEEFADIVAHDIRNPLNVASGRIALLQEEYDSDGLDEVESSLDRIGTIIDNTLTLAQAGRVISETEPVALAALANRCWQSVATADATLQIEGSVVIDGDPDRLRHLFENFFRNAVEHGGSTVIVRVGTVDDGFYVEDDGTGFPDDERESLLNSGYTTTETGTGLGLSIVDRIVTAHGWELALRDGEEGGARFEVTGIDTGSAVEAPELGRTIETAPGDGPPAT